jgi:group I intron endonuclease
VKKVKAVYKITNVKNGKVYIGSSSDSDKRKRDHFNLLRRGVHHNRPLQEEYNSFGEKAFEFEVLQSFEEIDRHELFEAEQYWIDRSDESLRYNLYCNAFGMSYEGDKNPMFGRTHSEGVKKKLSEINSGENNPWYNNAEHMEKMRSKITKRFDGRKHTKETRLKMSEAHKGRKKSDDERLKLRLNNGNKAGIYIDGVFYYSMSEASRQLGISRTTITSRVNNPRFENYYRCSEGVETNSKPEISTG